MALDLLAFNQYVADILGVSDFVAGVLISFLFLMSSIITVAQITNSEKVLTIVAIIVLILCAGLTWIPVWIPILIVLGVVSLWGNFATRIMGG